MLFVGWFTCRRKRGPSLPDQGSLRSALPPRQGAFPPLVDHPGRCHSIVRAQQGSQPVSSRSKLTLLSSTRSCTSIGVEGRVAWSFFFFCALDLMAWTIIQVLWIIIWLFRERVLDGCWLLLKRRVEKGSGIFSNYRLSVRSKPIIVLLFIILNFWTWII